MFVVMTANNVEILPAELLRKGRLDELFFCGLPTQSEREAIFHVHLSRVRFYRVQSKDFDFELLGSRSKDFSGAEIEQIIYEAMQHGFSRDSTGNEEFTMLDLLDSIACCIPLAKIAQPQIDALKSWAVRSGAKSASFEEEFLPQTNTSFLVVDENVEQN